MAERQADKTFKRQEGDLSLGILGKELANRFKRGEIQTQGGTWQRWMRPFVGKDEGPVMKYDEMVETGNLNSKRSY